MAQPEPGWIQMQKKTFTKWVNKQLFPTGSTVEDLYTDLSNGIKFIHLLQILFKDEICSNYNKNPKFIVHCSENVKPCFDYLVKVRKMKLVNVGPMDIVNQNHKLTLALIFQIIIAVQIENIEVDGLKGQHGLLLWVNRQIEPFGLRCKDFQESFRDGRAFAGLAAALGEGVSYDSMKDKPQLDRHAEAYDYIERDLGVAKLLDPEDFNGEEIDKDSVVTYVSTIFNSVASDDESRKHIQSIDKAAQLAMKHGGIIFAYERDAKKLKKDVKDKIEFFDNKEPADGKECRKLIKEHEEYKKKEKNTFLNGKSDLESILSDIHTSQRNENRPLYIPPEGLGPNDFSQLFRDLEESEDEYEKRLLQLFKWFLSIESLSNNLDRKCERMKDRLNGNIRDIDPSDLGSTVPQAQEKLNELQAKEEEDKDLDKDYQEIMDLLEQIPQDCSEYPECKAKADEVAKLRDKWNKEREDQRKRLEDNLEKQKELDHMEKQMVRDCDDLDEKLDFVEELVNKSATEDAFGTAEAENTAAKAREELDNAKKDLQELKDKQKELKDNGKDDKLKDHPTKPYDERIKNLEKALGDKEGQLEEKRKQNEKCEKALEEYNDLANQLQDYVVKNTDDVTKAKNQPIKDQQKLILDKKREYNKPPVEYKKLKDKEKECQKIGTGTDDFGPINSIWNEYGKFLDRKADRLADEEERAKRENLTPEEEALARKVFSTLDTEKTGLTVDQFREALQAMGINMSLPDLMAALRKMGYDVGPNLRLKFDDLKKFLIEQKATKNNKEDIQNSWKYLAKNKNKIPASDVDKYFRDQKSYPYLKETMPADQYGDCDYKEWTETAFRH